MEYFEILACSRPCLSLDEIFAQKKAGRKKRAMVHCTSSTDTRVSFESRALLGAKNEASSLALSLFLRPLF